MDNQRDSSDSESRGHENVTPPRSLRTSISPPPSRNNRSRHITQNHAFKRMDDTPEPHQASPPSLAAVEAGESQIENHLDRFSSHLFQYVTPGALLSISAFETLYNRNRHPHGRHFVVHQHDHPVAGLHYDLRLQINETSSISWAIMYGLPGYANSRRLNRNATETRVHNVWNHLIETASPATGSLLIWDTGEYEILPYYEDTDAEETDSVGSDESDTDEKARLKLSDSEKLHIAFKNRKIRLRLHGIHLPKHYTLSIRLLTSENRLEQPRKPTRKRRRNYLTNSHSAPETPPTSDLDEDDFVPDAHPISMDALASALEREIAEQEDEEVRRTNAYPGATNNIGSIHQRRWYLSMDRPSSGFKPLRIIESNGGSRREWVRRQEGGQSLGFEPFYVMGRDVERSVVTGRTAGDLMTDENVESFVGRKGWRAVTE